MRGPKLLFEHEDRLVTGMGAWFPGERVVFRGKDLFHDLKNSSWMGLLLYGITGRVFDEKQLRLFEGIWTICTSYPDPRLWNNRVAALAGTARSTAALGISAANAVSEASIYGGRPEIRAFDFLLRTKERLDKGANLTELAQAELKKHRGIYGYGRPITRRDERIKPLLALATELGFAEGAYLKLAFDVEEILLASRLRLHMNIAVVIAALAADQGFSRREYYHYMILCFSIGICACYVDVADKPEGTFFPMRCGRVAYAGKPPRIWARCDETTVASS